MCQIDACRLGGVNEVLAVLLLAAKLRSAGVPARGRRRAVRVRVSTSRRSTTSRSSGSLDGRMCEWADHLHEHFEWPVSVAGGRYRLPDAPGYGVTMRPDSLERFRFPDGPVWREHASR